MDISLIDTHAGAVWNVLHEKGGMDLTQLKKETKLTDKEIVAAIGWLAREGKFSLRKSRKAARQWNSFLWQTKSKPR